MSIVERAMQALSAKKSKETITVNALPDAPLSDWLQAWIDEALAYDVHLALVNNGVNVGSTSHYTGAIDILETLALTNHTVAKTRDTGQIQVVPDYTPTDSAVSSKASS